MSMKNLKPQQNAARGGAETAAVELSRINLVDPKNQSYENDYAFGYLLHDSFGQKAEFDESGYPTTEIRFQMRRPKDTGQDKDPPSVAKLNKRSGMWLPVPEGGIVVLERAQLDARTNTVMAGWFTAGPRDRTSGLEVCHAAVSEGMPSLMTVDKERVTDKSDGTRDYRQNRIRLDQSKALAFRGLEQFKANVVEMLDISPELTESMNDNERAFHETNGDGRGFAGVVVRGIELGEEEGRPGVFAYAKRIELGWNPDELRRLTPEESLERFLSNEYNADWVEEIKTSSDNKTFFELIPCQRYNTGRHNLPSNQEGGKTRDDSMFFRSPVIDEFGDLVKKENGDLAIGTGYAPAIMLLTRGGKDADFPWSAKNTFRMNPYGPISPIAEVKTGNLPPEIAVALDERAEQRMEALRDLHKGKNVEVTATVAESGHEPDEGPAPDEPDQSGGPSMSP